MGVLDLGITRPYGEFVIKLNLFSNVDRLTMLLQQIKEKLDQLNDEQLNQIADLIHAIEARDRHPTGQNSTLIICIKNNIIFNF
ncbi:hypothetical protein PN466_19710 [Roseofilum reptotaenium CS-1145]|uniref:Uncharacterized protein n=1 Tax=Roseofilum reptotaenium AO1-A TaxID=1925591 RepID=A0A1L9QXC5_9CYAN|nr:hypothetical protein [Roseofilum reptotaenium]MDB9519175.1 hypothetical protein [Roseofilum reptotaenium CS-1145]OJJ27314.1 hypothetical protein BI308_02190 [Roseofilum reptotaenium AO1-A]